MSLKHISAEKTIIYLHIYSQFNPLNPEFPENRLIFEANLTVHDISLAHSGLHCRNNPSIGPVEVQMMAIKVMSLYLRFAVAFHGILGVEVEIWVDF